MDHLQRGGERAALVERWTGAFEKKVLEGFAWPNPAPFVVTVNNKDITEIRTALIEMIDHANENVIIQHAYFSDNKMIAAVKRAAARGVRVDVVLPKEPDTHIYANMLTINKLTVIKQNDLNFVKDTNRLLN